MDAAPRQVRPPQPSGHARPRCRSGRRRWHPGAAGLRVRLQLRHRGGVGAPPGKVRAVPASGGSASCAVRHGCVVSFPCHRRRRREWRRRCQPPLASPLAAVLSTAAAPAAVSPRREACDRGDQGESSQQARRRTPTAPAGRQAARAEKAASVKAAAKAGGARRRLLPAPLLQVPAATPLPSRSAAQLAAAAADDDDDGARAVGCGRAGRKHRHGASAAARSPLVRRSAWKAPPAGGDCTGLDSLNGSQGDSGGGQAGRPAG